MSYDLSLEKPHKEIPATAASSVHSLLGEAERFIANSQELEAPTEEVLLRLALAHFTLASKKDLSLKRTKIHLNSAIAILKRLKTHFHNYASELAQAYVKRAEILEIEARYSKAVDDYQEALNLFEDIDPKANNATLPERILAEEDKMMLAQSAISIADLLTHHKITSHKLKKSHPLFYINQGLEYLSNLKNAREILLSTQAYAHFLAGLNLKENSTFDALEAFRVALKATFKTDTEIACQNLGDIYYHMGLLYANSFEKSVVKIVEPTLTDHAIIYFAISTLFTSCDYNDIQEDNTQGDLIFETIYRAIDPYLSPIALPVLRDFIDALLFAYYCILDETLPNKVLLRELNEQAALRSFVQHIYLLVNELFHRENPDNRLLSLSDKTTIDYTVDREEIIQAVERTSVSNIYYFPERGKK